MKTALTLFLLALGCCGCGPAEEDTFGHARQAALNTAVQDYCAWSGGAYWCQDWYSKSWCTNGVNETAWDFTNCQWRGWNSDGTAFCGTDYPGYSPGWEWGQVHQHCN